MSYHYCLHNYVNKRISEGYRLLIYKGGCDDA